MATLPLTQVSPFRFLPLDEAARITSRPVDELLKRAENGRILAGMFEGALHIAVTEDGELVEIAPTPQNGNGNGDDINARLSQIRREDFAHLEGVPITVSEAARKYDLLAQTIHIWVKQGMVRVLNAGRGRGSRKIVDESDVAYLAAIHHTRKEFGIRSGVPLLSPDGTPYLIKHPSLSQHRKK